MLEVVVDSDPVENAIEYFYEEGINEEGIDQLIEEIGLEAVSYTHLRAHET